MGDTNQGPAACLEAEKSEVCLWSKKKPRKNLFAGQRYRYAGKTTEK